MEPARDFLSAKKRGATVIAIKPSVEPDVGMSDIWVPLRPGTDAALALAMLHVVTSENLVDEEFVRNWCSGYEELTAHLKQYPPAWGERITGVPAEQIESVARLYATTKKAVIDLGNGVEHAPSRATPSAPSPSLWQSPATSTGWAATC
jgi:anaerobic selenocysteine-containing dehydrogenase